MRLILLCVLLLLLVGMFGLQKAWQDPYVGRDGLVLWAGGKYKIEYWVENFNHEEERINDFMCRIIVKDHRYQKWINSIKRTWNKYIDDIIDLEDKEEE